jgi:hypothetical protein
MVKMQKLLNGCCEHMRAGRTTIHAGKAATTVGIQKLVRAPAEPAGYLM